MFSSLHARRKSRQSYEASASLRMTPLLHLVRPDDGGIDDQIFELDPGFRTIG